MKKIVIIIFILIFSNVSFPQVEEKIDWDKALASVGFINDVLEVLKTCDSSDCKLLIDSIANSQKSKYDFKRENDEVIKKHLELGNELSYFQHNLRSIYLKLTYVTTQNHLLEIRFEYCQNYWSSEEFPESLKDEIKRKAQFEPEFKGLMLVYQKYFSANLENYKQTHPDVIIDYTLPEEYKVWNKRFAFINNPAKQLTYGFACSIAGDSPPGFEIIDNLIHEKKVHLLSLLLDSPNPVARLYAFDGLLFLDSDGVVKLDTMKTVKDKIIRIQNENTLIEICSGCSYEFMEISKAAVKFAKSRKNAYRHTIYIQGK